MFDRTSFVGTQILSSGTYTPAHEQQPYADKTLQWFQCDSEDEYHENLKHNHEMLVKHHWAGDTVPPSISYTFNAHGFRSREINVNDSGIAVFGCSFTTGVGLPLDKTYHYYVGQELNLPVDNFGVAGASNGVLFRLAQHWLPALKPKIVILQTTFADRFEVVGDDNHSIVITPHAVHLWNREEYRSFYQSWSLNEINGITDKQKTELAIRYLCHTLGIPIFVIDVDDFACDPNQQFGPLQYRARDLMHPGIPTNQHIGLQLVKKIQKDLHG